MNPAPLTAVSRYLIVPLIVALAMVWAHGIGASTPNPDRPVGSSTCR